LFPPTLTHSLIGALPMDTMEAIYRCVSGLDVHKKTVVACRRRLLESGKVDKEVKTFAYRLKTFVKNH
jgi:hypothetical protein